MQFSRFNCADALKYSIDRPKYTTPTPSYNLPNLEIVGISAIARISFSTRSPQTQPRSAIQPILDALAVKHPPLRANRYKTQHQNAAIAPDRAAADCINSLNCQPKLAIQNRPAHLCPHQICSRNDRVVQLRTQQIRAIEIGTAEVRPAQIRLLQIGMI